MDRALVPIDKYTPTKLSNGISTRIALTLGELTSYLDENRTPPSAMVLRYHLHADDGSFRRVLSQGPINRTTYNVKHLLEVIYDEKGYF